MADTNAPHRFRRRLRAAFILVAALSSATLAVVTYGATSSYRWRNFQEMANSEVRLALALAPSDLDRSGFDRLLSAYEKRSGTDAVAIVPDGQFFASSRTIAPSELPDAVRTADLTGTELITTETTRSSGRFQVVAGNGADGSRYVFFFSLEQLESSLAELRIVLASAWLGVVAAAAAVGELVARRTLRPVREASDASTALAAGLLDTRLTSAGDDEFAVWAESFNTMADALATKMEELRLAAERERQFTADVAHDLRTPLTGLAVRASLLLDEADGLTPGTQEAVRALAEDIDRLKDLVLDLLELARLDAGKEGGPVEALSVATAITATVQTLQLSPDVEVKTDVEDGIAVCCARGPFRRILGNLIANAATHGQGTITITARAEGATATIAVLDDGPGVDAGDRERIFHRFTKTDESRAAGGSGLGLAIAREHARSQAGDIRATAGSTGGACFIVTLPLAPVTTTEPTTMPQLQPATAGDRTPTSPT